MTAPAPRNRPAEDAYPAPTPAPVAVPTDEALFDLLLELNEQGKEPTIAGIDADGRAFLSVLVEVGGDEVTPGLIWDDQHCRVYSLAGDHECETCGCPARHPVALNQAEYPVTVLAPRPEPVVAPLPSEAVERIITALENDIQETHGDEHPEGTCSLCDWAGSIRDVVTGLVPEDDEDAVRVPRDLAVRIAADLIAMGADSGVGRAEWPAGDDFVTAVVEQTGQPR